MQRELVAHEVIRFLLLLLLEVVHGDYSSSRRVSFQSSVRHWPLLVVVLGYLWATCVPCAICASASWLWHVLGRNQRIMKEFFFSIPLFNFPYVQSSLVHIVLASLSRSLRLSWALSRQHGSLSSQASPLPWAQSSSSSHQHQHHHHHHYHHHHHQLVHHIHHFIRFIFESVAINPPLWNLIKYLKKNV